MRLYRQNFLTYMSQHGVNLMALVNEHFICALFQKEPWQDANNPYGEGLTLVGICRDVFKKIRPLAGKSFLEKTEESFDMADLLFVDSVFEMKLETSLLYWTLVRHPIHAALIAYGISKSLKKSTQGKVTVLKENMTTYRKLLIEAVNNSYYKSRPETFKMLKQQIPEWGSASCIQIALATSNKKFLSEAPLVNMRECIWNGHVGQDDSSNI
ncbi:unnamed protein product [Lymnaea stagnalis]|uniref:TRPM-like domain-containing protein n=1 Tax=Lymnaea stagnalis TaxID=6523 RepID=A0AAV2I321_LYMST